MPFTKWIFTFTASTFSFLFTFLTLWQLVLFLWGNERYKDVLTEQKNYAENINIKEGLRISGPSQIERLYKDAFLIGIFILQHSVMASTKIKNIFVGTPLEVLYRSIYVFATSFVLQIIFEHWTYIPESSLWHIDIQNTTFKWWIFFLIHSVAWIILYGGCVVMDFGDLMGIKQVYYEGYKDFDCLHFKSTELQILYRHMRHPSFLALSAILWIHPIMSLDRLFLALVLTFYMILGFQVDMDDYIYQEKQLGLKREQVFSVLTARLGYFSARNVI